MPKDQTVQGLLDHWESCRSRGGAISPEELCRGSPHLLDEVRRQVRALESMDSLVGSSPASLTAPGSGEKGSGAGSTLSSGAEPVPGFRLVRFLGRGGFGEVWLAQGPGGFPVAFKFLPMVEKVQQTERRALELFKEIRHPNLLGFFGAWQLEGSLAVAMEVADRTLLDRLAEARAKGLSGIPVAELLNYMRDAARGVDFLNQTPHPTAKGEAAGIMHRDVKPANLVLVGGCVKVADFGLARPLARVETGRAGGMTPAYAPPEFFEGATHRNSDQYSLAVSYCQLRGGRLPFDGNAAQVMTGHLHHAPDLTMLPDKERPAVVRALSKDPAGRWPSCAAFVGVLTISAMSGAPRPAAPEVPKPKKARPSRKYALWLAVGLVFLVLSGLVAWSFWRGAPTAATVPPQPPIQPAAPAPAAVLPQPPPIQPAAPSPIAPSPQQATDRPPLLDSTGPKGVSADEVKQLQAAWANYLGRQVEEEDEIARGVKMKFVLVPPGKFLMGSPESEAGRAKGEVQHEVELTRPFYLGVYDVTQAQYQAVTRKNPSHFRAVTRKNPSHFRGAVLPVESVYWSDADAFAKKLTGRAKDGLLYRLPTEAEWEYSCRGGRPSSLAFAVGDGTTLLTSDANFIDSGIKQTTPVDKYKPNALGLYDMQGNVWQWCNDLFAPGGSDRVLRGGSWFDGTGGCRAASRLGRGPGFRWIDLGFRLARVPPGLDK